MRELARKAVRAIRVVAGFLAAALLIAACSDDGLGASTLTQDEADALAAAVALKPADLGPDYVDDSESITDQKPFSTCLPDGLDVVVLAETPARSFKTEPDAPVEDVDSVLGEIQSVTIISAVFESERDAEVALDSVRIPSDSPCVAGLAGSDVIELEPLGAGDESVVYEVGDDRGLAGAFVRTGPVLSYVLSLRFDETTNLEIIEVTAAEIAAAVSNR